MYNIHKDHTQKDNISQVIKQYSDLGLQPVPLIPNQKYLNLKDWSNRSIESLWAEHWSKYQTANIGFRMGNGILVIDCDSVATSEALLPILKPFNPPIVETTTANHHHVYFKFEGYEFSNKDYIKFKGNFKGEIRYGSGAQCVAPPSVVNGSGYTLVSGSFENIPMIPNTLLDLLLQSNEPAVKTESKVKIIKVKAEYTSNFDSIEVPLDKIKIADYIQSRIDWLKTANIKGESYTDEYKTFQSRSEVEQSIIVHFIRCGYTEKEIYDLINSFDRGGKDFDSNYANAHLYLANDKTINKLQELYFNLPEMSFMAELVIKAIISNGVSYKTISPSLTKSKISEITGIVDFRTVQKYLDELSGYGLTVDHTKQYLSFNLSNFQSSQRQAEYFIDFVIVGKSLTDTLTSARLIGEVGLKIAYEVKKGINSAKNLTEKLNLALSTVYYNLNKLVEFEILSKTGDKFTFNNLVDFVVNVVRKKTERIKEIILQKRARYEAFLQYIEYKKQHEGIRTLKSYMRAWELKHAL